jgi:hypothetical protein
MIICIVDSLCINVASYAKAGCPALPRFRLRISGHVTGVHILTLNAVETLEMDSLMAQLHASLPFDASQRSLWIAIASITFNPTAWNIVARNGEFALL